MAYQTGVPTDEMDLLQQLVTFLTGLGWTSDYSAAEGLGWRAHLHKSGLYVNLRAIHGETGCWPAPFGSGICNGLGLNVGTGFSVSTAGWYDQAGVPQYLQSGTYYPFGVMGLHTSNFSLPSPYNMAPFTRYHFFATGDDVVVVLEVTPLVFGTCGWGPSLNKTGGTWTGGAYFFGVSGAPSATQQLFSTCGCPFACYGEGGADANGFVRADVDSYTGGWVANFHTNEASYGKFCTSNIPDSTDPPQDVPSARQLVMRSFSNLNAQANLIPVDIFAHRDGGGYSLLGTLPRIFATSAATYGNFSSGTVYSIGGDNYMVFAGTPAGVPGFAILKT
jgi:hypothetical protein